MNNKSNFEEVRFRY